MISSVLARVMPGRATEVKPGRTVSARAVQCWMVMCGLAGLLWLVCLLLSFHHRHFVKAELVPLDGVFEDLFTYRGRMKLLYTSAFFEPFGKIGIFAYPAPAAFVYQFWYSLGRIPLIKRAFVVSNLLVAALVCSIAWPILLKMTGSRRMTASLLAGLPLLSYPLLFMLERGNIEIVVCAPTAIGILAYACGRPYVAAICFGAAASVKPFPIALFGLFLSRRSEWKALLLAIASFCAVTLVSIYAAGPTIAIAARGFFGGVVGFEKTHVTQDYPALRFDHSFFSAVKLYAVLHSVKVAPLLHAYYIAAVPAVILGFLRVRQYPLLNRVCFLATVAVALPPIAYTYTLTNLYAPLLLMLAALAPLRKEQASRYKVELFAFVAMLSIFLPPILFGTGRFAVGGQLEALALAVVLALATMRPWKSALSGCSLKEITAKAAT